MTPAYAYLRVSGIGQVDGDGFDRQLAACHAFAAANGFTIIKIYREEGVSGSKELDNRPALLELLADLAESGVKTILIEKLDRLARDLMVQETIIADLRKSNYTLISVMEPDLCRDDPSRKLMRQIFGAIAEYDRAMIVLKLRSARERTKIKTGSCEGQKPYGFYPAEIATLSEMRRLRTAGMFCYQIASTLNASGLPARAGGMWSAQVIARILRRERRIAENLRQACTLPIPTLTDVGSYLPL